MAVCALMKAINSGWVCQNAKGARKNRKGRQISAPHSSLRPSGTRTGGMGCFPGFPSAAADSSRGYFRPIPPGWGCLPVSEPVFACGMG